MALFLKDDDVQQSVSMSEMLEAIEHMQNKYGQGEAYNLTRRKIIAPGGLLSVMGGGLYYDNILGVKTYTVVKGKYSFQVSLYDAETGALLCYTQANRLGQLRTGATTGIAVKYLSNPNSSTLGIIGTGYQAPTQLEAISKVRNIQSVKAFSPTPEHRESFAKNMNTQFDIPVLAVDSAKEAVEVSDIVISIAATMDPVIDGSWLSPGTTVIAAGPTTWRAHEVNDDVLTKADKIIVDSLEQAPIEAGDLSGAVDRGILQWSQLYELRHSVSKQIIIRDDPKQIIFAKLMGTGVADVCAAKLAYDNAKATNLGIELPW